MKIIKFRIRASYPNYFMVKKYAEEGRDVFNRNVDDKQNLLRGNKPGTIRYLLEGDIEGQNPVREFPPRWYDMYYLLKSRDDKQEQYIMWLLMEWMGDQGIANGLFTATEHDEALSSLETERNNFRKECIDYVASNPLVNNTYLITSLTDGDYNDEEISYKGRMLLDLTRDCFPVPDFCILTAAAFNQPEMLPTLLEDAIRNLEIMTNYQLGDSHNPLVFAIRCAMPQYIPGLMPTLLNIGVTRQAYEGLRNSHADAMANRVYLSTLHTLCAMIGEEKRYHQNDIELSDEMQLERIMQMEETISHVPEGERLISDASYQALRLVEFVRDFYLNNQDLILTFMQGKQAYPSLILQRMVWTIGNNESYPGVLYSRHSRTGKGRQIESYRNIFGEEIMTGDVTSEDISYSDRTQIKSAFQAVFHFDPLLPILERRYKSPVTIEFAVETRPHKVSLFSVLQLNMSEMTGRAALVSAIDMYSEGLISDSDVVDLIKPYHLRQIVSASIDDNSLRRLQFFGKGLSVLPRTAITAVLCFSTAKAKERKAHGDTVCLCQERFVPEDTITLNEVDAICSMTPAAIHVVTACRGYGIPAFMDLHSYGIRRVENSLVNESGLVINEYDKITLSSKRQNIYIGVADFKPARFTKYLHNQYVELAPEEEGFFQDMRMAYEKYQEIVTSERASFIGDIDKLARLIRCDLQDQPDTAKGIVNNWFIENRELYVQQVLKSKMGSHQDQSRVFDLLSTQRKAEFFRLVSATCIREGLTGLKAGSFMLGRFVSKPIPKNLWNTLSDTIVAFLLNEYVLYEKYLQVLVDVGEIKLARAHSRIETEGIDNMTIENFDLVNFAPLLYSSHDWHNVAKELEKIEHQDNTHLLIAKISRPKEEILGLDKPWNRAQVDEIMHRFGR